MELTNDMIRQLASLARLEFDEVDTIQIREDLARMIGFVEKLQELDTTGVEPLLHMSGTRDVLRDDEIKGSMGREDAMKVAPDTDGKYFYVPKVIKK